MTRLYKQIKKSPILSIDFDGVIHPYTDGFKGKGVFDSPLPYAVAGMKALKSLGYDLYVWTCRKDLNVVTQYLKENLIPFDKVTSRTKISSAIYVDDRGLRFNGSWPDLVQEIESFKLWYARPNDKTNVGNRSRYEPATIEAANYLKYTVSPFLESLIERIDEKTNALDRVVLESIMDTVASLSRIVENV